MMTLLADKQVCANCGHRHTVDKNPGYDHTTQDVCDARNDEPCPDVWNTTCDSFCWKCPKNKEADTDAYGFKHKCYEIYKLKWMQNQGIGLYDLIAALNSFAIEYARGMAPINPEAALNTAGNLNTVRVLWENAVIHGDENHPEPMKPFGDKGFWVSFDVFNANVFKDKAVMETILGKNTETFDQYLKLMNGKGQRESVPEKYKNVVYCDRNCVSQENGYCTDDGVVIDNDGYCTGYVKR